MLSKILQAQAITELSSVMALAVETEYRARRRGPT